MPAPPWRSRIVAHARIRAGDLVPHPLNPRTHPDFQARALRAVLDRLGFARSLLAYKLPDGRLQLIDGHLRQSLDPDALLDVEILDLDESEARELLLCLDPLARLALTDTERAETLRQLCPADTPDLRELFNTVGKAEDDLRSLLASIHPQEPDRHETPLRPQSPLAPQFLVLAACPDEHGQKSLLAELRARGLDCRPLAGWDTP
jgi:hypothetical protein